MFHDFTFSTRDDVQEVIREWNARLWLPKIIGTDRQCHVIKMALSRPFFQKHWRDALAMLVKCSFLILRKRGPCDIDFFCEPDNFDKIIEGKYLDHDKQSTPTKTIRNGDDEEIL